MWQQRSRLTVIAARAVFARVSVYLLAATAAATVAMVSLTPSVSWASGGSVTLPWSMNGTGVGAMRSALGKAWWEVEPAEQPGLQLVGTQTVRTRLYQLTFTTPDVPNTQEAVRILLPPDYSSSEQRYPVLFLLHGCCNGASPAGAENWTNTGAAESITLHSGAIIVTPDTGGSAMTVDWYDGQWKYDSFVIDQLLPWIDLHLRTVPTREQRAVAGLSMGGYSAMYLAARYPYLFSSEAAFSGIDEILRPTIWESEFVDTAIAGAGGGAPGDIFGSLETNAIDWHDHDPGDLVVNLRRNVAPLLEYGDPPADPIEATAAQCNQELAVELEAVGIDPTVHNIFLGTHGYDVWNPGLENFLPIAEHEWNDPLPPPDGFDYIDAAPTFSAFNYTVQIVRPVREFATLGDVTAAGFRLTGSGKATVTTAPRYTSGGRYVVTTQNGSTVLSADRTGRLTIAIDLGSSASTDEFSPTDISSSTTAVPAGNPDARPGETVQVRIRQLPAPVRRRDASTRIAHGRSAGRKRHPHSHTTGSQGQRHV